VAITSVGQGYESTEERHDYKTGTGTTYGGKGQPMTTTRMGSPNASIVTSTDIWQKSAEQKRKNAKQGRVSNTRRKDILPRTTKESRQ